MLQFENSTHTYSLDGIKIPSVTQVIEKVNGNIWGMVNAETLEIACQRGTAVHKITELHDKDTLNTETIDPDLLGYYEAYLQFLTDCKPEFSLIEKMVYSEMYQYAGTLDRTGKMQGYKFTLDIKTGVHSSWTGCQLAAYQKANNDAESKRLGLYLKKTGKYSIVVYDNPMDFNVFLSALNIYNFNR